ncbi:alpha/beta hydrolase [Streptomyces sp. M19]
MRELGRVAVPTLVLWGERDGWLPSMGDELTAAIPGARQERIADAGHFLTEDNPGTRRTRCCGSSATSIREAHRDTDTRVATPWPPVAVRPVPRCSGHERIQQAGNPAHACGHGPSPPVSPSR